VTTPPPQYPHKITNSLKNLVKSLSVTVAKRETPPQATAVIIKHMRTLEKLLYAVISIFKKPIETVLNNLKKNKNFGKTSLKKRI